MKHFSSCMLAHFTLVHIKHLTQRLVSTVCLKLSVHVSIHSILSKGYTFFFLNLLLEFLTINYYNLTITNGYALRQVFQFVLINNFILLGL